jgi:hypothetical protein
MKIIDYITVAESHRYDLEKQVRGWINHGWQPIGGAVPCVYDAYNREWVQTMVKYEADMKATTEENQ